MTKTALIVKWHAVSMGYNARPSGISVHRDEEAVYGYIARHAYLLGENMQVPGRRMARVNLCEKTQLAFLVDKKGYVRFADGETHNILYRQAVGLQPVDYTRIHLNKAGIIKEAQFIAQVHEDIYATRGYRSAPNWGAFAL